MPEAEMIAIGLMLQWLEEKSRGETGLSWTISGDDVTAIPAGYYGVVRVELRRLGGEPVETKYEKCGKCGEMHVAGEACPYARVKVQPE